MSTSRLSLFLNDFGPLPEGGVAVFGAEAESDLSGLPRDAALICRRQPDFDRLTARGFSVAVEVPEAAAISVVFLPRAKDEARLMLAQALALSGRVIVDGPKTQGVDSILKALKARVSVGAVFSKAHGKAFEITGDAEALADWAMLATPREVAPGLVTVPGVFSADGIDPGSALLVAALPARLGAHCVDLGAGWGFLSREILNREGVERVDLVEADHGALSCARENLSDRRAVFHWADALNWRAPAMVDSVIMNPPFHQGAKGAPHLGRGFIRAAAAMLKPAGDLWMVANRHLPYEQDLAELFGRTEEIGGDNRFKLLRGVGRKARVARTSSRRGR